MPDPSTTYENRLLKRQAALAKRIGTVYKDATTEIVFQATTFPWKGELFSLRNFPALQQRVNEVMKQMHTSMYSTIINGVEDAWDLSNSKNDVLVDKRLVGRVVAPSVRQLLYDPNAGALKAFTFRKERGLNLSERVWNVLEPFPKMLEQTVGIGLSEGKSAAEMATEVKQYLNDPDKLFRRVERNGELVLSKAARDFHPGQGVYRSSYKNALRLTRTETNIAYRSADHERWQNIPFIVGIEIRLSNNHPRYDICDPLAGKYPKDFKFTGWHPNCRCNHVPIQLTDSEFDKYEDELLGIGKFDGVSKNEVNKMPSAFNDYLDTNRDRIKGWKNRPYWVKDNKGYVSI